MRRTFVLALALTVSSGCGSEPPDPETLVRQLREGTAEQRDQAVQALTKLGDQIAPVLPEIEKAVLDKDPEVRRAAVKTLTAYGADAKSGLIVALGDAEADIRQQATEALGALGVEAEKAIPNLVERLDDADVKVAAAARRALVQLGDASRPALSRVVVTGEAMARDNALRAMVEIGESSIPDLISAAQAHEADVRRAVLESLIVMRPPPEVVLDIYRERLADPDSSVRDVAARAVQGLGEKAAAAADDLIPLLGDKDNAGPAAWALRDIGPKAVPALSKALTHDDKNVRLHAAQTLGEMKSKAHESVDELVAALDDEEAAVRREAIAALAAMGPPDEAIGPIAKRLSDEDERTAHRAGVALEKHPNETRGVLETIAKGDDATAAKRARDVLDRLPAPGSDDTAAAVAPTDPPTPPPEDAPAAAADG